MTGSAATRPSSPESLRALRVVGELRSRVLDPVDRFAEATFGLIMVLTITGALRVAEAGSQDVRDMLVAALGCNIAWGLVDGTMYVVTSLAGRARAALVHQGLLASDDRTARSILLGVLPDAVAATADPAELDRMVARVRALPPPARHTRVTLRDLRGALASALIVFAATLPPTLPYVLVADLARAERLSETAAVVSLFLAGWALGKKTGIQPVVLGVAMVLIGAGLVALTMALGG